jgi:RNA polymerase sigma factor (sigma-70 family)
MKGLRDPGLVSAASQTNTLNGDPGPLGMAGRDTAAHSDAAARADWINFYDAEYHSVLRFVMRTGASLEAASDAAQEAFVDSWMLANHQPESWSQIHSKRAWIRTVALRKYLRPPGPRRRPTPDSKAEIPDFPDPALEPGELTAQTQAVLEALSNLDPEAHAVMAFRMDGFATAHIADVLGLSEQRVRDITKKARTKLRRSLESSKATA